MVAPVAAVVQPADPAGVAEALRAAAADGRTVVIRGAGTKAAWGGPLSTVDVVLSTAGLTGVVSHEPGDRVVTVRAGTPLRTLQEQLAGSGQRLSVESGFVDATVGGVLASGEAGPLRLRYGSGRDVLIGVEFVRADGVVARAGGRVVKNVAGYDLGRLLCGSYGTIGVITTATFRLHPLPAAAAWVVASVRKDALLTSRAQEGVLPDIAADIAPDIAAVVPSAVECDLPGPDGGEIAVLVEGSAAGVAARAAAVESGLRRVSGDVVVSEQPPSWWGRYPFRDGDIGLRIAAPVSLVGAVVDMIAGLPEAMGGAVALRGSPASGVLYANLPSTVDSSALTAVLAQVRSALAGTGGSCVVVTAPPVVRDGLDLWGEVAGLPLMRRLKAQFDPAGRFAAGRFVGGL